MNKKTIKVGMKVKTVSGKPARIKSIKPSHDGDTYPIIGKAFLGGLSYMSPATWTIEGKFMRRMDSENDLDLG